MANDLTTRQREFCDRLADLCREYVDAIGPVERDDDDQALSAADMNARAAVAEAALSEWLLLLAWVDLESGESFTTKINLPDMPSHHQLGLVQTWTSELM